MFRLETAGVLLDAAERLRRSPAALGVEFRIYRLEPGYVLVFSPPVTARKALFTLLGEYGACLGRGAALAAFAAEHGRLLQRFCPEKEQN